MVVLILLLTYQLCLQNVKGTFDCTIIEFTFCSVLKINAI